MICCSWWGDLIRVAHPLSSYVVASWTLREPSTCQDVTDRFISDMLVRMQPVRQFTDCTFISPIAIHFRKHQMGGETSSPWPIDLSLAWLHQVLLCGKFNCRECLYYMLQYGLISTDNNIWIQSYYWIPNYCNRLCKPIMRLERGCIPFRQKF